MSNLFLPSLPNNEQPKPSVAHYLFVTICFKVKGLTEGFGLQQFIFIPMPSVIFQSKASVATILFSTKASGFRQKNYLELKSFNKY